MPVIIAALIIIGAIMLGRYLGDRIPDEKRWGPLNSAMICPHCQTKGSVRTQQITQKAGISGGKATAAILTAGVSLLGTGLSRKEQRTQAHCGNCHATWQF
jgi:transcription elongation factor Elf1